MSWLDIIYLFLLVTSIPLGALVKSFHSRLIKEWLCLICGISITLGLNGIVGSVHSFVAILGNFLVVKVMHNSKYCPLVSFVFVFAYLLFYRLCPLFGLPQPPKHSNAVQLLVTLRMISLAFEITDEKESTFNNGSSTTAPSNNNNNNNGVFQKEKLHHTLEDTTKQDIPSFFNFLSYGYCYIGLLTGPFYTFKTFRDMLHQTPNNNKSSLRKAVNNLKPLPLLAVVYLFLKSRFPLEDLKKEEFFDSSFSCAFYTITFTSMWFRWRFYIGWLLAESSCISCGLGEYPVETEPKPGAGPTKSVWESGKQSMKSDSKLATVCMKLDSKSGTDPIKSNPGEPETTGQRLSGQTEEYPVNYETIHNIMVSQVELGTSMKDVMRDWNMTVQWWMSTYVYKRLPFKSYYTKLAITLSVSAFWHGIHAGYYLSFLSAVFMVFAQNNLNRVVTCGMNDRTKYIYGWFSWLCLFRYIDYCAVPFMLLQSHLVFRVWGQIYFSGHLLVICFMLVPLFMKKRKE